MPPETKIPNSAEIDQALKEFEMKSSSVPQASTAQASAISSDVPKMVRLVMKLSGGAIKEERQAEYVLLGVVVILIGVSLFLFFGGNASKPAVPTIDGSQYEKTTF